MRQGSHYRVIILCWTSETHLSTINWYIPPTVPVVEILSLFCRREHWGSERWGHQPKGHAASENDEARIWTRAWFQIPFLWTRMPSVVRPKLRAPEGVGIKSTAASQRRLVLRSCGQTKGKHQLREADRRLQRRWNSKCLVQLVMKGPSPRSVLSVEEEKDWARSSQPFEISKGLWSRIFRSFPESFENMNVNVSISRRKLQTKVATGSLGTSPPFPFPTP